jgi:hypothetical protein
MLRCAIALLAAPIIAASAQGANASPVRIEVSAEGYRLQSALDSIRAVASGQRVPAPVIGSGKLVYAVAPGDEVTIVATTPAGRVHVEVSGEARVLGVAEGHTVTVRNRNGVISFDVQRVSAWTPHFTYGTIFPSS